jgi:tetratricopeptide (TPR) repeat protein
MSTEHTVLVSMMKNEAENCLNMLASVEGLYDTFIIGFDSSATDGTRDLVIGYMQSKEREGIYYEFDWHNDFSEARNHYLNLATEMLPDKPWLLIMDGDDLLSPGDPTKGIPDGREVIKNLTSLPLAQFPYKAANFYVHLDPDHHGIPSLFYPRVHLVRNLPDVRFEFASHNAITVKGEEQILIRECVILHHQKPKKRAEREVQRVEMNIPNLQAQGDAGEASENARGLFYLANTQLDAGDLDGAEKNYLRYLDISTWNDERYQARIHLATLYMMRGQFDHAEAQAKLTLVEPGQWSRAEGYMVLSDCCLAKGETVEAIHWIRIATQCKPMTNGLFLQGHLYTWFPHWRLALIFDRIGCPLDALKHAELASKWRPDDYILESMAILQNRILELRARGLEVPEYDKAEDAVPIYAMPEAAALERLGYEAR